MAGVLSAVQGFFTNIGFKLCGENQGSVVEGNSTSRPLEHQLPGRVFYLFGNIYGFRPGEAVIGTFYQHKLTGFGRFHPRFRSPPKHIFFGETANPQSGYPKRSCCVVVQHTGVANTIEALRTSTPFAHVHDHLHGFPGLSAIGAPAHAYINVFLQIFAIVVAIVVNRDQGPFVGGDQSRNPVGIAIVLSGCAKHFGQAILVWLRGNTFNKLISSQVKFDPFNLKSSLQISIFFRLEI